MKLCPIIFFGFGKNFSAMIVGNLFAKCKPDAGAGIFFPVVQPLKNGKDLPRIFLAETDSIIADGDFVK